MLAAYCSEAGKARTTRLFMVEQAVVKGAKPHWALFDRGLAAEVVATM